MAHPSLGICAIVKDEADYIEEWLAFHLLQGAGRIVVYDNASADGTREILNRASTRAPVTVVDWSKSAPHFDLVQRAAYANGAGKLAATCDFAAFMDIDEFLHAGDATVAEALAEFPGDVSAIAANQRIFGSSYLLRKTPGLVTSRFTRCAEPDFPEHRWFKTIARPREILAFDSVHSAIMRSGRYVLNDLAEMRRSEGRLGQADSIGAGRLTLNHYLLKSREEFAQKSRKWRQRPEMQGMYETGYFAGREPFANKTVDDRLAAWAERIQSAIAALR